jgi:hypothetical protein
LKAYIEGRRPVGKPRRRWINAVDKDAQFTREEVMKTQRGVEV